MALQLHADNSQGIRVLSIEELVTQYVVQAFEDEGVYGVLSYDEELFILGWIELLLLVFLSFFGHFAGFVYGFALLEFLLVDKVGVEERPILVNH